MKKLLLLVIFATLLSAEITNVMVKTEGGFVMKPFKPRPCGTQVEVTSTGFRFTGRIIWGEPMPDGIKKGDPYTDGIVFVSEGKTRAWEYVGKTDENGTFSLPIKPYEQFKLYAWDGTNTILAKYEGHFYYNSELDNLYMTPTGGEPYIADKGDVVVEKVENE